LLRKLPLPAIAVAEKIPIEQMPLGIVSFIPGGVGPCQWTGGALYTNREEAFY
jgi:hypothetical protein